MSKTFTGRHMAAILIGFFGVVIAVNLVMAYFASTTFGGLVVENSYVASQKFNGWLAKARAEHDLGWSLDVQRGPTGGRLQVMLDDASLPLAGARITAIARHPLGRLPERDLRFGATGVGRYESMEPLPAGRWIVQITVSAHGKTMHRIVDVT